MSIALSVSSIAAATIRDPVFHDCLRERGIGWIDVAPTMIAPDWNALDAPTLTDYRTFVETAGFRVGGMQSLFYGVQGANILGDDTESQAFLAQMDRLEEIASALGATRLVLGSPPNRRRGGHGEAEAEAMFVERLRPLCDAWHARGLMLCIEANPPAYGCDFATHYDTAAALVRHMDSAGFRLNFDTGCATLGGDDPVELVRRHAGLFGHVHVSEPHLAGLAGSSLDHEAVGRVLRDAGYDGLVCLEMRHPEAYPSALAESLDRVREAYLGH